MRARPSLLPADIRRLTFPEIDLIQQAWFDERADVDYQTGSPGMKAGDAIVDAQRYLKLTPAEKIAHKRRIRDGF